MAKLLSGEAAAMSAAAGCCCAQHLLGSIAQWTSEVTVQRSHNLSFGNEGGIKQNENWVNYIQTNSAVFKLGV